MKKLSIRLSPFFIDTICFICVVTFGLISFVRDFYTDYILVDTIEHTRATLAISSGLVPYIDFFEHHHPLLWYILSPLAKIFYLNSTIIPVFRVIGTLAYLSCFYMIYLITKKLYTKKTAWLSVLCLMSIPTLWFDVSTLRPDSFMLLFFLLSLKLFFDYLDAKKAIYLIFSYVSLSISFLFLQKMAIFIIPFGMCNLYAIWRKKIEVRHFIIACLIGSSPILICLFILLYNDMLSEFIYYNYSFNFHMQSYFGNFVSGIWQYMSKIALITFLVILRVYRLSFKSSVIFFCFVLDGLSLLYFAPHPQYYIPYFTLASLLIGQCINEKKINLAILMIIPIFIYSMYRLFPKKSEQWLYDTYMQKIEMVIKQNMYDDMIDFRVNPINIFGKFKHFYWFGYSNVVIIDLLYNKNKVFEPVRLLETVRPKYLYLEKSYWAFDMVARYNNYWFLERNSQITGKITNYRSRLSYTNIVFWTIERNYIHNNYTRIGETDIYERKY